MSTQQNESEKRTAECLEEIIIRIDDRKEQIENKLLLQICENVTNFWRDNSNPHLCHELAEAALNLLIKRKYARDLLTVVNPEEAVSEIIKPLAARLPTETWRSREQNALQQFSTSPAITYLLAWLLNFRGNEQILEPSAGTGSLAVWLNRAAGHAQTNEIDSRRRDLLHHLGFQPTAFNAEFIHDYLSPEITINCVMMNPPFSANGERTKHPSSKFGFRHVASALERLSKGGKFGIILGEFADLSTKTGREFWEKMSRRINVKALIKIAGREYYKNGTRITVTLIIGEKLLEERNADWNMVSGKIAQIPAQTVEEAFSIAQNLGLRLD